MIIVKTLESKYLKLEIMITHHGKHNHERINASVKSIHDFNFIIDQVISSMNAYIKAWEEENKEAIERVGK